METLKCQPNELENYVYENEKCQWLSFLQFTNYLKKTAFRTNADLHSDGYFDNEESRIDEFRILLNNISDKNTLKNFIDSLQNEEI